MNFNQAIEDCEFDDIRCESVLVCDDVASAPKSEASKRRGVAGMVYAFKCAGAAADEGRSLNEVTAVAKNALANIRTMGVALSPCIVPEVGKPTFTIAEDEMEIGMGIHGEKGIMTSKMMPADQIAATVLEKLLDDMPLTNGDEISVMVNGLGATPLEEQLIVYRYIAAKCKEMNVTIVSPHIGEFATSMEMSGLSITIFKLDKELKKFLLAPANTPFYTNANK